MRILGIHGWGHDTAAALFDDYRLIAAVQEERLTRIKSWGDGVPWLWPSECLRALLDGRVDFVVTNEGVYTTSRSEPALETRHAA